MPSNPPPSTIQQQWMDMISSGRLTLGEPCCPYTIQRYCTKDRMIIQASTDVCGRMITLTDVRERLLKRQEKFMRLQSDPEIEEMTIEEITQHLSVYLCSLDDYPTQESLRQAIHRYQRQRSLVVWHDHATLLN